jgi:hypothetical protein
MRAVVFHKRKGIRVECVEDLSMEDPRGTVFRYADLCGGYRADRQNVFACSMPTSVPHKVPEASADLSSAPFERVDRFDQDFYISFRLT